MTFGQVLSRGVSAAHRSVPALICLFLLYGLHQGASLVVGGLVTPESVTMQRGQTFPAEFGMLMAFGLLSCAWLVVMVFVGPAVTAGVVGQLRDRLRAPGEAPGSFAGYGGRFYVQLLILTVIFVVIAVLVSIIVGLLAAAVVFEQLGSMMMQPQQMEEFQTHPLVIGTNVLNILFLVTLAVVLILAQSIVVLEYTDPFTAIGRALGFIWARLGDTSRLWGITACLALPAWGMSWIVQGLGIHSLPVLLILGTLLSVFVPYALLLLLAWSVSLLLARRPEAGGEAAGDAPGDADPGPDTDR